jgi:7,8-dihydropterin-6-yl-methyl-4-(beta-D-ribofuranosyl)aminobenzene 5'-phosphate synthase
VWQPDRLVHDDQAVVLNVRDRGLVILTGCGHAGIVNIIRQSTRTTGISRVHAICGGLHLRSGPVVERTIAELVAVAPAAVVGGHCTSWEAQCALASALPAAFLHNAVGSTFVFTGFPEVQPEGSRA